MIPYRCENKKISGSQYQHFNKNLAIPSDIFYKSVPLKYDLIQSIVNNTNTRHSIFIADKIVSIHEYQIHACEFLYKVEFYLLA